MPSPRNIITPGQQTTSTNLGKKYKASFPAMKPAVADRLRAVEEQARTREVRASRCCGRCRTPYNCGNKGCPCHTG